jgi:hypothetical protein
MASHKRIQNMEDVFSEEAIAAQTESETMQYQGRIEYITKPNGDKYAVLVKNTYVKDNKVMHDKKYLGKVISPEKGIYYHRNRGFFIFSFDNGIQTCEDDNIKKYVGIPHSLSLHFGDIWIIDQVFKMSGLERVLDNIIPESKDTLKSLVAFKLVASDEAYKHVEIWYQKSYASILYPNARVESPRLSEFLQKLGKEEYYRKLNELYIPSVLTFDDKEGVYHLHGAIDSTGISNAINMYLTAVSNHNGDVNNEMRLIYVVDMITKMPIYYNPVPGNIVDNSTLFTTINKLLRHNIRLSLLVMDAGYSCMNNLEQLAHNDIPFLTRMTKNLKEYKNLMLEHGDDLLKSENSIEYGKRVLFGKKVNVEWFGKKLYAYVMLDPAKLLEEITNSVHKKEPKSVADETFINGGKFILITSNDYDINEILPLYYLRQTIEQIFDVSKTYAGLATLRVHTPEGVRGGLMISFLATALYSAINARLSNTKYNAHSALFSLHNSFIKLYDSVAILEDFTKQQKEILSILKVDCPFLLESGNPFHKPPLPVVGEKRKRGRPQGRADTASQGLNPEYSRDLGKKSKRGRPKGSKNKPKPDQVQEERLASKPKRKPGRPPGSKNKPKLAQVQGERLANSKSKRKPGRPPGSKNKPKLDQDHGNGGPAS